MELLWCRYLYLRCRDLPRGRRLCRQLLHRRYLCRGPVRLLNRAGHIVILRAPVWLAIALAWALTSLLSACGVQASSEPATTRTTPSTQPRAPLLPGSIPPVSPPNVTVSTLGVPIQAEFVYETWVRQATVTTWHKDPPIIWPLVAKARNLGPVQVRLGTSSMPIRSTLLVYGSVGVDGVPASEPIQDSCSTSPSITAICTMSATTTPGSAIQIQVDASSLPAGAYVIVDCEWYIPNSLRPNAELPASDSASWGFQM